MSLLSDTIAAIQRVLGRKFFAITEVSEADLFQHVRLKLRQHIHVAVLRVEIMVQHRTEQAQFADAAFPTKTRNLLAVNFDG